jgi:methionyl-tRNA formyltransferase
MAKRIAVFGQAAFGKDVLVKLADAGHEIVGVYAPPDKGRPDPLAAEADARGLRLLRHPRFRRQGAAIPELVAEYRALGAELNVMPYTTVILPPEIVDAPAAGSLCFHPSLLPRFRGGAAIPWQIILGERETGVTVFQPDAGVDTGPIVLQRGGVPIDDADNAATLYFQKLYPLGVEAVAEAVDLVDRGAARPRAQDESRATFQGLVDDAAAAIDFAKPAEELARLVRGCDPQPGAWARFGGAPIRLFDARFVEGEATAAPGTIVGADPDAIVVAARGGAIRVGRVKLGDGKKVAPGETSLRTGDRLESAVA